MNKEYSMTIDGQAVSIEFKDCLIHTDDNHVGNIDAIVTTTPPLPQNLLLDELHIKLPGTDEFLYIYGYGVVENSLKATFNASKLIDKQNLPTTLGFYWGANGEQFIGETVCIPYSEKAEHQLDDEIIEEVDAENEIDEPKEINKEAPIEKEEPKTDEKIISKTNWIVITAVILVIIAFILFHLLSKH